MMKILRSLLLSALATGLVFSASAASSELVFIGSGAKDIYACRLDLESGDLTTNGVAGEMKHVSFMALHPNHHFLYAVGLTKGSNNTINAFGIEPGTGKLTWLNQMGTGGGDPCHVTVDYSGEHVFAANYGGGSVAAISLGKDGMLEKISTVQHNGTSVDPKRQSGPHAHCIITDPGDHHVLACDLGLDEVLVYTVNTETGKLMANDPSFGKLKAGAGPRHIAMNPKGRWAYVVNELDSTITVFDYDLKRGELNSIQNLPMAPADFKGKNYPAEVAVASSGKFVYGSNRGHDSIAVFAADQKTGQLTLVECAPAQGKNPRHIEIDPTGKFLLVANVDSGNVVVFRIDGKTGKLTATGHSVEIKSPMCVKVLAAE